MIGPAPDFPLSSEQATACFRILQESLTNVAKHARAKNVAVLLDRRADNVSLVIEDDGVGFDPANRPSAALSFARAHHLDAAELRLAEEGTDRLAGRHRILRAHGLAPLCRAIFNSNEFLFLP